MKKLNLVRTIILAGSLSLQLSTLCLHSHAAPGDVDLSFDPGSGVNRGVTRMALQPDGKVIIGGGFTTVKGLVRTGVARLHTDGSGDSSFNQGEGNSYAADRAIALQSDGKVLVGNYYGIARLNFDGTFDTNFSASLVPLNDEYPEYVPVESIVVQPDGKVLIGGWFYTVNGTNSSYGIARLNSNGSPDNSFHAATLDDYAFYYGGISSVALQPDGKVLVGGEFGNSTNNNIARLNSNGSLDTSFGSGAGPNGAVRSVVVQSDGKVLIGGDFTMVNVTNRNKIARLNANGSLDGSFDPGTDAAVNAMAVQSDGKVLIGGYFNTVNGTNRNRIARLNANGTLDSSFDPGTGANYSVYSLALQSDGQVLVGGDFTTINGTNLNRVARFDASGNLDLGFDPGRGLEVGVSSVVVQSDGKVLIGGGFTFINGTNRYGSARLNADGSLDGSFVPASLSPQYGVTGFDYSVAECSAVQPDGKVLLGGWTATVVAIDEFNNYYWSFGYFVSRVNADGSRDTNFNPAVGGDYGAWSIGSNPWGARDPWSPTVRALTVQPDGKVLVGSSGIFRLNSNGSADASFISSGIYNVNAIELQSDGKVLVGTSYGVARLRGDGSREACFNPTIGNVNSLGLQPDGKVLVGGSFTVVNGVSRNGIARLNENGSLDSSFNPGAGANETVRSIALQSDGNVLIGGDFTAINGIVRTPVARLFGGSGSSVGPPLRIFSAANNAVTVAWPSSSSGVTLQQNTGLATANWVNVTNAPATVGLERHVTITALVGQRFFRLSVADPAPPPPPAPTGVTATVGDGFISLNWPSFPEATGFHVLRATNYSGPFTTIASPSTTNYTDTTAVNGSLYYYVVSATYPCAESFTSYPPVGGIPHAPPPAVHVASITMSFVAQGSRYYTRAVVRGVDNTGTPVSGATVTGDFTGAINNTGRTGSTIANGEATITSSSTIKNGTVTFTVTSIAAAIGYNPAANVVTSASITR